MPGAPSGFSFCPFHLLECMYDNKGVDIMTEKQFLRAAIDEYFRTGKKLYQDHGRVVLVNFEAITRYKMLPEDPPEYKETSN